MPDGPSGRVPVAYSDLDSSTSNPAQHLVLFNDGTIGTKFPEKSNFYYGKPQKSFDGSTYSMIYHSPSDFSSAEYTPNQNKGLFWFNLFLIVLTLYYFSLYYNYLINSSFPDFFPSSTSNIFAVLCLLPILIWISASSILDFSSGELKIYPKNSDPHRFKILSKKAKTSAYLISVPFVTCFAMIFHDEIVIQLVFVLILGVYLIYGVGDYSSRHFSLFKGNKRIIYPLEISALHQKIIQLTKELLDSEKVSSPLLDLLLENESVSLEFKGSLWTKYNTITDEVIKSQDEKFLKLQDSVVKTVAAFLNTEGGTLLIGVKDKPRDSPPGTVADVLGIEPDFRWLKKNRQDVEGFQHELINIFSNAYTNKLAISKHIKFSFPVFDGLTVCRIDVTPLRREKGNQCYTDVKEDTIYGKKELFFARIADTSKNMSPQTAHGYISEHFENF